MGQAAAAKIDILAGATIAVRANVEGQHVSCIPLAVNALPKGICQLQDMVECFVRQEFKVGVGEGASVGHRRNY